jgi:hypothetical protein
LGEEEGVTRLLRGDSVGPFETDDRFSATVEPQERRAEEEVGAGMLGMGLRGEPSRDDRLFEAAGTHRRDRPFPVAG